VDLKEFDLAENYYRRALDLALLADLNPVVKQCYEGLSNALAGKGRWKESLDYHKQFVSLKDSLFSEDKFRIVNELQTQYETEKREKLLAEERAENAEKDREIERQRTTNFMLYGGIAVIILFGGALTSRQRQKQKARLSEAKAVHQQELVKERERGLEAVFIGIEDERQRIAKDLHDGVGQQLSGIKLSLNKFTADFPEAEQQKLKTVTEVVDNVAQDVRSLSHQMMPKALQELGLVAAIGDMLEKSLGLGDLNYDFEHFNADKRYNKRVEIGLYRICQELINNIIKHAHASHAVIQLFENKSTLILIVEDNGQGFDLASKKDGIGLMNIESRLNTVSGDVNWQPSPGSGTVATVRIPIISS
jgi:signal transduction histidine kinase